MQGDGTGQLTLRSPNMFEKKAMNTNSVNVASFKIERSLKVDDGHDVNYQVHGNENGETFVFLHGGPGIGVTEKDLQYFDLERDQVILIDQRGCGKSRPLRELKDNSTQHLINDIASILDGLNTQKVYLFGGSWGSTLALLFAIQFPERVKGLVLRGVFTATKKERAYFENGRHAEKFPIPWKRLCSFVPKQWENNPMEYYFNTVLTAHESLRDELTLELYRYGMAVGTNGAKVETEEFVPSCDYVTRGILLAHYSIHDFFISDGYIQQMMHCINHVPIKLVHGIHDHVTLFSWAEDFAGKFENVDLIPVNAAHSPYNKAMVFHLKKAVEQIVEL